MFDTKRFEKMMQSYTDVMQQMKEAFAENTTTPNNGHIYVKCGNDGIKVKTGVNSDGLNGSDNDIDKTHNDSVLNMHRYSFEAIAIAATRGCLSGVNAKTNDPEALATFIFNYTEALQSKIDNKFQKI